MREESDEAVLHSSPAVHQIKADPVFSFVRENERPRQREVEWENKTADPNGYSFRDAYVIAL